MYAGYGFAKGYDEAASHSYTLRSISETPRVNDKTLANLAAGLGLHGHLLGIGAHGMGEVPLGDDHLGGVVLMAVVAADGLAHLRSHELVSPLENPAITEQCGSCHKDIAGEVRGWQKEVTDREHGGIQAVLLGGQLVGVALDVGGDGVLAVGNLTAAGRLRRAQPIAKMLRLR